MILLLATVLLSAAGLVVLALWMLAMLDDARRHANRSEPREVAGQGHYPEPPEKQ